MLTREAFIQDRERVFDKVYGALSGLAIGDSFGDASRKPENRANYAVTTDFNKGASWSTDDTEFALLTAKTLIQAKQLGTPVRISDEEVEVINKVFNLK